MLVIVRDGERQVGIVVDEVEDVIMADLTSMQRPLDAMRGDGVVRGLVHAGSRLVAVLGSILMIGLVGIIIASLVNMFMHSEAMGYVVSILGVLIFTGLTAYDMQKLKGMSEQVVEGTEQAQKMALMGALTLYLDFINLFLMLLRLFGRRK